MNTPIPISKLIGALGIQNISEKKCQKMLRQYSIYQMLTMKQETLSRNLVAADNIGLKTATIFSEFIDENRNLIEQLLIILPITEDTIYEKNVVFTGFRDDELKAKFNQLGFEVSGNVNSDTRAVISASYNHDTGSCREADRRGIQIIPLEEVDDFLQELKDKIK